MSEEQQITETTTAVEETGSSSMQVSDNQETKTFTQEDVDRIIQNRLKQVERKFEGVDVDEYKTLKQQQAEVEQQKMIKKEKFEELLQQQKSEYENRLNDLTSELHKVHIDGALLSAAAKHKAVNPEHISDLLRRNIRLGENNQVEVLDADGNIRYNTETAEQLTVEDAVSEFLNQNPYFRSAQPSGSGSASNTTPTTSREVKLSDLDMNNPEHRKIYQETFMVGNQRSFQKK